MAELFKTIQQLTCLYPGFCGSVVFPVTLPEPGKAQTEKSYKTCIGTKLQHTPRINMSSIRYGGTCFLTGSDITVIRGSSERS
jgi:hypothetical protein